jgi:hypothetical membrane protein
MIKKKDIVFNYSIFIATVLILMLAILSTKRPIERRVLLSGTPTRLMPNPFLFR